MERDIVDCRNCSKFVPKDKTCSNNTYEKPLSDKMIARNTCGPYTEITSKWKRVPCTYL